MSRTTERLVRKECEDTRRHDAAHSATSSLREWRVSYSSGGDTRRLGIFMPSLSALTRVALRLSISYPAALLRSTLCDTELLAQPLVLQGSESHFRRHHRSRDEPFIGRKLGRPSHISWHLCSSASFAVARLDARSLATGRCRTR
jgi:hypothetical protein